MRCSRLYVRPGTSSTWTRLGRVSLPGPTAGHISLPMRHRHTRVRRSRPKCVGHRLSGLRGAEIVARLVPLGDLPEGRTAKYRRRHRTTRRMPSDANRMLAAENGCDYCSWCVRNEVRSFVSAKLTGTNKQPRRSTSRGAVYRIVSATRITVANSSKTREIPR